MVIKRQTVQLYRCIQDILRKILGKKNDNDESFYKDNASPKDYANDFVFIHPLSIIVS